MPSLNIKNEQIYRNAQELAKLTGESVTAAVGEAINERLDREQRLHKRHNRLEWLVQLSKETSALVNDGRTSKELMDELYDPETGLPV